MYDSRNRHSVNGTFLLSYVAVEARRAAISSLEQAVVQGEVRTAEHYPAYLFLAVADA